MNKEVIYLESEDDITDILTKLQQAEQKLVALVPPKKATILRSAVNMKLVARVAKECEKVVVIVTADPAIVKMAMGAKIPVAKNLQSRPVVPTEENVKAAEANLQMIDEDLEDDSENPEKSSLKDGKNASKASKTPSEAAHAKSGDTLTLTEDGLENASKRASEEKSKKQKAKNAAAANSFFEKYRKWIAIGSAAAVVLIIVLVWAFVFAPAVKITVAISSTPNNFAETIHFTTDPNAENIDEGIIYAEQISADSTYKTDITATGKDDRGEKATGRLTVSSTFTPYAVVDKGFALNVPAGTRFTSETTGLVYIATESKSKSWDGDEPTIPCDNGTISATGSLSSLNRQCVFSVVVDVEAEKAGEVYDVASGAKWLPYQAATVANGTPIAGGTTNMVKVISDDDIEAVKEIQLAEHTEGGKEDLLSSLKDDVIPIESSFKGEVTDVKTTPARDEEVEEDVTPTAELKITYSIYVIDKASVEAFIKKRISVPDDQKIYSYGEPYIERFSGIENDARLKTTVETGPTVTEETILEKVKGKKTGEVQSLLRSINGVSSVNIQTSYFWVWSVPTDPNRITIDLTVEER